MALALDNLQRVDMPLNKETEPSNKKTSHSVIGLISLFNDISTFVGYLMLKPFL